MNVIVEGVTFKDSAFGFVEFLDSLTESPVPLECEGENGKMRRVTKSNQPVAGARERRLYHGNLDRDAIAGLIVLDRKGEMEAKMESSDDGVMTITAQVVRDGTCEMSLFVYSRSARAMVYEHAMNRNLGPRGFLEMLKGRYRTARVNERKEAMSGLKGEERKSAGDALKDPLEYSFLAGASSMDHLYGRLGKGVITAYVEPVEGNRLHGGPVSLTPRVTTFETVVQGQEAERIAGWRQAVTWISNTATTVKRLAFSGVDVEGKQIRVTDMNKLQVTAALERQSDEDWIDRMHDAQIRPDSFPYDGEGKLLEAYSRLNSILQRELPRFRAVL